MSLRPGSTRPALRGPIRWESAPKPRGGTRMLARLSTDDELRFAGAVARVVPFVERARGREAVANRVDRSDPRRGPISLEPWPRARERWERELGTDRANRSRHRRHRRQGVLRVDRSEGRPGSAGVPGSPTGDRERGGVLAPGLRRCGCGGAAGRPRGLRRARRRCAVRGGCGPARWRGSLTCAGSTTWSSPHRIDGVPCGPWIGSARRGRPSDSRSTMARPCSWTGTASGPCMADRTRPRTLPRCDNRHP